MFFILREIVLETGLKRTYFDLEPRIIILHRDGIGMSDVLNVILDPSTGLIHKIQKEHLYVHFNTVSGDSVIRIVSGFLRVLIFSSFYSSIIKFCSGGNLAYYVSALDEIFFYGGH